MANGTDNRNVPIVPHGELIGLGADISSSFERGRQRNFSNVFANRVLPMNALAIFRHQRQHFCSSKNILVKGMSDYGCSE